MGRGASISANGKTYEAPPGCTLTLRDGVLYVDGKRLDDSEQIFLDTAAYPEEEKLVVKGSPSMVIAALIIILLIAAATLLRH